MALHTRHAFFLAFISAVLVAVVSSTSASIEPKRISTIHVQDGPWVWLAVCESNNNQTEVTDFLAICDPQAITGDNLIAVWYEFQPSSSSWLAKTWLSQDLAEIIKSFSIDVGIGDYQTVSWPFLSNTEFNQFVDPIESEPYLNGLIASDPLASIVSLSPMRNELVSYLAEVGYKIADIPSDKVDENCPNNLMLTH